MAKLRHIAIIVPDPEKAAKFFEEAFDMHRAGTARRGIYMSDGVMNVALGLPLALAAAHNAGAALLLLALVVLNFFAFRGLHPFR